MYTSIHIHSLRNSQNLTNPQIFIFSLSRSLSCVSKQDSSHTSIHTFIFTYSLTYISSHILIISSSTFSHPIRHTQFHTLTCWKSVTHRYYITHSLIHTHCRGTLDREFYSVLTADFPAIDLSGFSGETLGKEAGKGFLSLLDTWTKGQREKSDPISHSN